MKSLTQSIRVALFFIFGLALIWIVHETLSESTLYSDTGYEVKAPFGDVKQLKKGADVRLAGVSIGAVTDTRLEGGKALVLLSIEKGVQIPVDSEATITTAGLLGNNYVAIELGHAKAMLGRGDSIGTRDVADISDAIEEFKKLVDKFSGDDENGDLFGGVNRLVDDMRPKIDKVLDNLETVSGRLADGSGTLGKLIKDNEAYDKLIATADDLSKAANDASDVMKSAKDLIDGIDDGKGALGLLVHDEKMADDLKKAVANINEFSEKLNGNEGTLGRLVSSDELYTQAKSILNKVDNAVDTIENSGPITAVGVVAGSLF